MKNAGKIIFTLLICISFVGNAFSQKIKRESIEWSNFWMPHNNDTELPHVLLIGNSIVMRYSGAVEQQLAGIAYCSRFSTSKSLGDPLYLNEIKLVLQHKKFDVIHFNNGLHGFDYTEQEYINDLPKLFALLKKYSPDAELVWATTTPYRNPNELEKLDPLNDRVIERNRLVEEFLQDKDVRINDLYSLLIDHPEYFNVGDGVHPNEKGTQVLIDQVMKVMQEILRFQAIMPVSDILL